MRKACESLFVNAKLVTDRFHVIRLSAEAMQKARIDQRWKEIDRENKSILQARKAGKSFKLKVFREVYTSNYWLVPATYFTNCHTSGQKIK
jgi:transposase